ncbi:MAG: lysine--tRNA ligase [Candidatus Andersenbacteria bacterium]|nr:lysine--tRNA ligase [Candidatus Andersenbacteria bacterium]
MKDLFLTREGMAEMQEKLHELKTVRRREIAEAIHSAKEQGDLSENAEYASAKEEQSRIESEIADIETTLKSAQVVSAGSSDKVSVGVTVTLDCDGNEKVYRIVGSNEADPLKGKISNESPVGQALLGKMKGDTVSIPVPGGKKECCFTLFALRLTLTFMAEERLEEIRAARIQKRKALLEAGISAYPSEARRTHALQEIVDGFENLQHEGAALTVIGRVLSVRAHGGLAFLDIGDASGKLQLQLSKDTVPPEVFQLLQQRLDAGDFIEASGGLTLTKRGVKTLDVKVFHIISKSIRPLPDSWYGLKDHETRYRQREVDLALDEKVRIVFLKRSIITNSIRQYLARAGFMEVETPMLQPIAGGTLAKPFVTHHNALNSDLFLRIAPELYLKRLIVGGYEKVFEIGRNFRNEGIDKHHNPEFTMLEFYEAYADYEDLMVRCEEMLRDTVKTTCGSELFLWQGQEFSFAAPFARRRYIDIVSEKIGIDILHEKDPAAYETVFVREGLAIPAVKTYAKMVDELYKELIRPGLRQPTILYDYPVEMVPLAKTSLPDPRVAEMFQLVVAGTELVKAYTELNDPMEQRARFEEQQSQRESGDEEAHAVDESYLRAMEYGMPPVAGLGLGIDRLTMLLTDCPNLRDTILFPLLKPERIVKV